MWSRRGHDRMEVMCRIHPHVEIRVKDFCRLAAAGDFSLSAPVYFTSKTDRPDIITEILFKKWE